MAVDLGFIDKDCHLLESRFFPSKIGGKPAWLNLGNIPTADELTCSVCSSPLYFLCQLYCPLDDKDSAFHRALFVFLCTSKDCFQPNCNSNFLVYRNQLSKRNPYYPDTPPIENLSWRPDITPAKFGTQVCSFCGIRSGNVCSAEPEQCSRLAGILPEYGLSIEPENEPESDTSSEESDGDDVNTTEYETRLSEFRKIASAQDDPSVEQIFSECSNQTRDTVFAKFKSCIEAQPEQVIRYDRDGEPLWLSEEHVPTLKDVPECENCGKTRIFEFQILPQLLNHLNFDREINYNIGSFDWGTLAIYTCPDSCDSGPVYKKEFIWKQDVLK